MDTLIENYIARYNHLSQMLDEMVETGEIPNGDVEGAPSTMEAAEQAFYSMLYVLDQVIHDLMILRMEQNLAAEA